MNKKYVSVINLIVLYFFLTYLYILMNQKRLIHAYLRYCTAVCWFAAFH